MVFNCPVSMSKSAIYIITRQTSRGKGASVRPQSVVSVEDCPASLVRVLQFSRLKNNSSCSIVSTNLALPLNMPKVKMNPRSGNQTNWRPPSINKPSKGYLSVARPKTGQNNHGAKKQPDCTSKKVCGRKESGLHNIHAGPSGGSNLTNLHCESSFSLCCQKVLFRPL